MQLALAICWLVSTVCWNPCLNHQPINSDRLHGVIRLPIQLSKSVGRGCSGSVCSLPFETPLFQRGTLWNGLDFILAFPLWLGDVTCNRIPSLHPNRIPSLLQQHCLLDIQGRCEIHYHDENRAVNHVLRCWSVWLILIANLWNQVLWFFYSIHFGFERRLVFLRSSKPWLWTFCICTNPPCLPHVGGSYLSISSVLNNRKWSFPRVHPNTHWNEFTISKGFQCVLR